MENVYKKHGYKNREDYLKSLTEEYDIDYCVVTDIADMLGPSEDFDGLVSMLEDAIAILEDDIFF